ncbi:hypothetical protein CXB51_005782 [Gossypium anomalum]|uniref:Aminotransferase-like plant mobile domain-containing protein n=1 Tax=Gossypium anomalum TaxID=47600 RepID=A0A8J5ZE47_9ROSI|nr:hypothetical protein CXB51_005782 [Gossypium anomalum]
MAEKLIRLDNKHISVDQMTMSIDRVLQCYICNMPGPPSPLIENYLREAKFWHVATIGRGCKLDPKLISALVDRYAVTGSASSTNWGAVCYELLSAIPDNINGGRIEMGWLRDTFLEPNNDSTELERIRYARAYILEMIGDFRAAGELSWGSAVLATLYKEMCKAMRLNKAKIGGCLSLLQSWARFRFPFLRYRVDHPYTFPLIKRWNHSVSYIGIPTPLENIRLVLDQRSEAQFQWTPYEDPAIRAVIPDEFLQNPNPWHVKVALVDYATMEMHQSDRVLRQFGFRQPIPLAPKVFDDEHKVDLQQLHTDWLRYWTHYIKMWEKRHDYIPTREPIIVSELACVPEYMPWFRIHGKPYLLSKDERRRQIRAQRERRGPLNPRRMDDDAGPSIAPTQSVGPIVQPTTPTSQPFQVTLAILGRNSKKKGEGETSIWSLLALIKAFVLVAISGLNPEDIRVDSELVIQLSRSLAIDLGDFKDEVIHTIQAHLVPCDGCEIRGVTGLVHLRSRLLRVNYRSIGCRRMRDRMRCHRGARLSTNPHHLTGFKHFAMCDGNTTAVIILSRWVTLPTPTTRSPAGRTTTPARSWSKEDSNMDPSTTLMWH